MAESISNEKKETIPGLLIGDYAEIKIGGIDYYSFSVRAWPPDDMESADGG